MSAYIPLAVRHGKSRSSITNTGRADQPRGALWQSNRSEPLWGRNRPGNGDGTARQEDHAHLQNRSIGLR